MQTALSIEDILADAIIMRMGIASIPREKALVRIISILSSGEDIADSFLEEDSQEVVNARSELYSNLRSYIKSKSDQDVVYTFTQVDVWKYLDSDMRGILRELVTDWATQRNINISFPKMEVNE